jgi:hypothetical protein
MTYITIKTNTDEGPITLRLAPSNMESESYRAPPPGHENIAQMRNHAVRSERDRGVTDQHTMTALTWQELCDSVPTSMRDVDDYLAGVATLSEDERAALWLYAWCQRDGIGHSADSVGDGVASSCFDR